MIKYIESILDWYKKNYRDLPWRNTRDPYAIVISEVMLQQTQVDRVIVKYNEFLQKFPTVHSLASAKPSDVIRSWSGLGYNRRALFLQKTAQAVVDTHDGAFPRDIAQLKLLPGVGEYTARAILSFAFDEPVLMMDTNHRKFYRLFFPLVRSDKTLLERAEKEVLPILKKKRKGKTASSVYMWNQALMDFGSAFLSRGADIAFCPVPELLSRMRKQHIKKNIILSFIPFKQTQRYVRGRIIDLLRKQERVMEQEVILQYPDIDMTRVKSAVAGLEKDGLIRKVKRGIVLI